MRATTFMSKTLTGTRLRAAGFTAFAILNLTGCATDTPPPPEPILPTAPAISIAPGLPDAAAVYVAYVNTARNMRADFADPQAIHAHGLNAPYAQITFDFVLHREQAAAPNTVVNRAHAEAA